ncbi:MAG: 3-isopropylmalate dehydratase small subunit [Nocardioidaceae bacterium]|nr:3-isopropylmalate dehydratase small subunit [Nocardioidaceae bacterium]
MDRFRSHTGTALPLRRGNVDTDQIIPAEYLKRITRSGFADGLFAAWKFDQDFVLNSPEYGGASVLVAGPDFGVGSSREHAVWALQDYGFKAVLSPCFGDIFSANAGKSGLLAAVVDLPAIERLWSITEADPATEVTVDLVDLVVRAGSWSATMHVDDYTRWRMLEGLDDIEITLGQEADITRFESSRPSFKPATQLPPQHSPQHRGRAITSSETRSPKAVHS